MSPAPCQILIDIDEHQNWTLTINGKEIPAKGFSIVLDGNVKPTTYTLELYSCYEN